MTTPHPKVTLTLPLDDVNLILDALGSRPFVEVYALIGEIQRQSQSQLSDEPPAPADTAAAPRMPIEGPD